MHVRGLWWRRRSVHIGWLRRGRRRLHVRVLQRRRVIQAGVRESLLFCEGVHRSVQGLIRLVFMLVVWRGGVVRLGGRRLICFVRVRRIGRMCRGVPVVVMAMLCLIRLSPSVSMHAGLQSARRSCSSTEQNTALSVHSTLPSPRALTVASRPIHCNG